MISFVCGQLCSGKSLYSKALAAASNSTFVEVGDIVRNIKNTTDRQQLQKSKELHKEIVKEIQSQHEQGDLVVCGVRQKEILKSFPSSTLLWIECSAHVRKERYLTRSRTGDTQTFEEAEQGDVNLGILEVKKYIFNHE